MYWMSRYIERAENLARLMQVSVELLLDGTSAGSARASGSDAYWLPVLAATAMEGTFQLLYPSPKSGDVAHFLTLDEKNPDSILSCLREARENARTVRDQITDEMWAELNHIYLQVSSPAGADLLENSPQTFFEKIIESALRFEGITSATLARNEGWHFLQLGRFLERADKTSRFLDIKTQTADPVESALESLQWGTILRACSAQTSYRRTHGTEFTLERVLDMLLFSTDFPRSVRFCVRAADEMLHYISGTPTGQYSNKCEKHAGSLLARLNFSSTSDVLKRGLHEYIDDLQVALNETGQAIFETYVFLPQDTTRPQVFLAPWDPVGYHLQKQQEQQQQQSAFPGKTSAPQWLRQGSSGLCGVLATAPNP
jgi:uncharacterized alpha-E superfamily protein